MNNWIVSTSAGIVLVTIGSGMMRAHLRDWGIQKQDASLEDSERIFQYVRFRRRMQASAILTALGLLIPVGVLAIPWQQFPIGFDIFWIAVLLLTIWVIVLGIGDAIATSAHARVALGRIRRKQRELESQVSELRRRRANGRDSSRN